MPLRIRAFLIQPWEQSWMAQSWISEWIITYEVETNAGNIQHYIGLINSLENAENACKYLINYAEILDVNQNTNP